MVNQRPLISIIIPVYNVEMYLEKNLDSVLNQTYKNIEVICIDDGSTDSSPDILKRYNNKYSNLNIYLQAKNQGQGTARNIGLKKSSGDFILFVDSDDYIELDTVTYLVEKMLETNVDFVRFNGESFSSGGEVIKEDSYRFSNYLKEDKIYKKQNFNNIYLSFIPSPVLYMFKSQLLIDNNITFSENIIHEDEVFSAKIFLYAEDCLYVNKYFYNRRYRAGSTMTKKSKEQKEKSFRSYIKIIETYKKILSSSVLSLEQQFFLKYRINSIYVPLLKTSKSESQRMDLSKIKENKKYYSISYKNYIRILKAITIFKNKLF